MSSEYTGSPKAQQECSNKLHNSLKCEKKLAYYLKYQVLYSSANCLTDERMKKYDVSVIEV